MFAWLKKILGPVVFEDDTYSAAPERLVSAENLRNLDQNEGSGISLSKFLVAHGITEKAVLARAELAPTLFTRAPQNYDVPVRLYMHAITLVLEQQYPNQHPFILSCAQHANRYKINGRRRADYIEHMVIALEAMPVSQDENASIRERFIGYIRGISTFAQDYNAMFLARKGY